MLPRRRLPVVLLCLLAAPAPASAKNVENLWATVNRCDTPTSPNTIGVRASMPGTSYPSRLYMRFVAQYYSARFQVFLNTGSSSRWLRVGSGGPGKPRVTQSGFNFTFSDPPAGEQFVLRGVVQYRYTARRRRKGKLRWTVVKQYERLTRSGWRDVQAGDPPGASDALCVVRRGTGEGR